MSTIWLILRLLLKLVDKCVRLLAYFSSEKQKTLWHFSPCFLRDIKGYHLFFPSILILCPFTVIVRFCQSSSIEIFTNLTNELNPFCHAKRAVTWLITSECVNKRTYDVLLGSTLTCYISLLFGCGRQLACTNPPQIWVSVLASEWPGCAGSSINSVTLNAV